MIGSIGARMLRIAAPHVQAWNAWYADTGNTSAGVGRLRAFVDAACADVGRDPAAIERTVAVLVRLAGGRGRITGDTSTVQQVPPLAGEPAAMADELRVYAQEGIAEVQLVIDPVGRESVERLAAVLRILDAG